MTEPGDLVVERHIKASAATIFRFFLDGERWTRWQGIDAEIDLRPGGAFRVNVTGDGHASGRFTEVVPDRRVVFAWGWDRPGSAVPPGSSTVEVELIPLEEGTLLRLTHRDLPRDETDVHRFGWENYARRLAAVAEGRDPGPDPLRADGAPG